MSPTFSIAGLKREQEGQRVPSIMFTKGGGQWIDAMADAGCDALGLDWTTDLRQARARVGSRVALQGNIDPSVLFGTPAAIRAEVAAALADFGTGSGHVFNLGHGISQFTPVEAVATLVDAVHELSRPYH